MAKYNTLCPACGKEIHVYSEWAGQEADCPACKSRITVPEPPKTLPPAPRQAICPRCGALQNIPPTSSSEIRRNCIKCGTTYYFSPGLTFRCAEILPPNASGERRFACPYCDRHYTLKYIPANGLIGCLDCMNIFAAPANIAPAVPAQPSSVPSPAAAPRPAPLRMAAPVPLSALPPEQAVPIRFFPAEDRQVQPEKPLPKASAAPQPVIPAADKDDDEEMVVIQRRQTAEEPLQEEQAPQQTSENNSKLKNMLTARFGAATAETLFGILQLAGNILWMLCGGLFGALLLAIDGLLLCLTIILIPFGLQMFKLAGLVLCPFGADVYRKTESDKVGCLPTGLNILWLFFGGGIIMAFANFLLALIFFATVIGTPFALQYLKIGKLVLTPFGLEVRHAPGIKRLYIIAGVLLLLLLILL